MNQLDKTSAMSNVDFSTWMGINNVLQGYADSLDRGDLNSILMLFTPDAIWDYSPGVMRQGHDAIRSFFEERLQVFARTSHNVCPPTVSIGLESGTYKSTAYFMATHLLRDESRYTVWGRYVDVFRMTPSGLLISRRGVLTHVTEGTDRKYNLLARKND